MKIVYDYDDVLWGLNLRAYDRLKIPFENSVDFSVFDNPHLTPSQREALIATYQTADTFTNIDFFPSIEDILRVEELGATVYINSNCYNQTVLELKRQQLQQVLPQLNPAHIQFNLIGKNANRKVIDADTDIFVDDSPYNIATSHAKINIMPVYPWNTTTRAKQLVKAQSTVWCQNLQEITQYIYQTVANQLKNQPSS